MSFINLFLLVLGILGTKGQIESIFFFLIFAIVWMVFHKGDDIDEVRVVCVDIAKFDFYEIFNHFFCLVQRFCQEFFHHLENPKVQIFISFNFRYPNRMDQSSELFMNELGTLQRRKLQSADLSPQQILERRLR